MISCPYVYDNCTTEIDVVDLSPPLRLIDSENYRSLQYVTSCGYSPVPVKNDLLWSN